MTETDETSEHAVENLPHPDETAVPDGEAVDLGPTPGQLSALATSGLNLEAQYSRALGEAQADPDDEDPDATAAKAVAQNVDAWHKDVVGTVPDVAQAFARFYGQSTHESIQGRRQAIKDLGA